jgi:hypothetical protein
MWWHCSKENEEDVVVEEEEEWLLSGVLCVSRLCGLEEMGDSWLIS